MTYGQAAAPVIRRQSNDQRTKHAWRFLAVAVFFEMPARLVDKQVMQLGPHRWRHPQLPPDFIH